MRFILNLQILFFFSFYPFSATASEKILSRVGEAPPFSFNVDGVYKGINIELYNALVETAGLTVEQKSMPWSRSIKNLADGKMHLMAFLTPSDDRDKVMHFIGPHSVEEFSLFINRKYSKTNIDSLDAMIALSKKTGLKFGLQQDYLVSEAFHQRYRSDSSLRQAMEIHVGGLQFLRMVHMGRMIGLLEPRTETSYRIRENPSEFSNVVFSGFSISKNDVFFGVSKKLSGEVVQRLQIANKKLIENGTYNIINQRWN